MNIDIIKRNLEKSHYPMTDAFAKLVLAKEYDLCKKGETISFNESASPETFIASLKIFAEEFEAISNCFTEFVNEFFTCSEPSKYMHSHGAMRIVGTELQKFSIVVTTYLSMHVAEMSLEELKIINRLTDSIKQIMTKYNEDGERFLKYLDVVVEIEKISLKKNEMSFCNLITETTKIMDQLVNVIDENTIESFTQQQLIDFRESCILHIRNSKDLVEIGISLEPNEEDEINIRRLMAAAMRLSTMVKQINLFIK